MSHAKPIKKLVTLDAEMANWLLVEVKPFIADRPLVASHVAKLFSEMTKGHFLPEITTIMTADLDGTIYRINGQHTATAVLEMVKVDSVFSLKGVTLLAFTVENETELRQLYARVDRGTMRSNANVIVSLLSGTPEFKDVTPRVLKLLATGLSFYRFENTHERNLYTGETAAFDVMGDYLELAKLISALMGGLNYTPAHHGHIFRAPVVAALYATYEADYEDAKRFWTAVATGIGFESETEPVSRLRQTLKNSMISGGHLYRGSKVKIGSEDMFRACIHAWNRYRANGSFKASLRPTGLKSRKKAI